MAAVMVRDEDLFTDRDPVYVATQLVSPHARPTMARVHEEMRKLGIDVNVRDGRHGDMRRREPPRREQGERHYGDRYDQRGQPPPPPPQQQQQQQHQAPRGRDYDPYGYDDWRDHEHQHRRDEFFLSATRYEEHHSREEYYRDDYQRNDRRPEPAHGGDGYYRDEYRQDDARRGEFRRDPYYGEGGPMPRDLRRENPDERDHWRADQRQRHQP